MATKLTQEVLQSMIRKIVKEEFKRSISDIINEKLEDFENEIADAINEAVDLKLDKKIKTVLTKKTLKEKVQSKNDYLDDDLNNDWAELIKNDSTKSSPLREKLSTGILEEFRKDIKMGGKNSDQLRTLPAPTPIDLNEISGNPDDYSSTDDMIDNLANADYGDLI